MACVFPFDKIWSRGEWRWGDGYVGETPGEGRRPEATPCRHEKNCFWSPRLFLFCCYKGPIVGVDVVQNSSANNFKAFSFLYLINVCPLCPRSIMCNMFRGGVLFRSAPLLRIRYLPILYNPILLSLPPNPLQHGRFQHGQVSPLPRSHQGKS